MRYPIVFITIISCLVASDLVYSQSVSVVSNKQLARGWEQSAQKSGKEGLIEGNAVLIFDGDTIGVVTKDGTRYTIRLRGIDAPENRQPFGLESANQLAYLVQGMDVVALVGERDANNRCVGAVFIDGEDVSLTQIRKGMAWHINDPALSKEQKDAFKRAEDIARTERVGLWAGPDPVAPWIFRGESIQQPGEGKGKADQPETSAKVVSPQSSSSASTSVATKPPVTESPRKYVLGPRGGCYYLNEQGAKVYVRNKDLCTKQ